MELIQTLRGNIRSFLKQCDIVCEVTLLDGDLYQDCIDDAIRRGYPVEGNPSVQTYLRLGVMYAATAGVHLHHRPTQIWIALYTSCTLTIDDAADNFPAEIPSIYLFNERLIINEPQGNDVLDAFADLVRRASELYQPIASHRITAATMGFVTATLLEYEMKLESMKISRAARQYPTYLRFLSGDAEPYSFFVFPQEIPLRDYIQAIPEITTFINDANDVLSFYKEERVGETTNQVSVLAARVNKSKLETYTDLTKKTVRTHKRIVKILEGSTEACEAFKYFAAGYVRFHASVARYRLEDLGL